MINKAIKEIKDRRERLLDGKINVIPLPFKRFSDKWPGLCQETYYLITSFSKGAKTQFTLFLLFEALRYYKEHRDQLSMKIIYVVLEESDTKIIHRFMSWLLFWKYKKEVSPTELRSTTSVLDSSVLEIIESDEFMEWLNLFEEVFDFINIEKPLGIYSYCSNYAKETGTYIDEEIDTVDDFGNPTKKRIFKSYTMNDPNEYRFVVIDHTSLLAREGGTLKESIDKMSELCAKYLRNRFKFSPIIIQQQSTESESMEAIKLDRTAPTTAGLSDSKYTQRDCNIAIGIHNPFKFKIKQYMDYDITFFKDNIRFAEILINRDGELGSICPMYFNGKTTTFAELPKPDDLSMMAKWKEFILKSRAPKKLNIITLLISKIKNL